MKTIKDFLIKKIFKGKLLSSGFGVVCGNYAFNIVEGEIKNVYIGNKGQNWFMVYSHLLTYEEMRNLVG